MEWISFLFLQINSINWNCTELATVDCYVHLDLLHEYIYFFTFNFLIQNSNHLNVDLFIFLSYCMVINNPKLKSF